MRVSLDADEFPIWGVEGFRALVAASIAWSFWLMSSGSVDVSAGASRSAPTGLRYLTFPSTSLSGTEVDAFKVVVGWDLRGSSDSVLDWGRGRCKPFSFRLWFESARGRVLGVCLNILAELFGECFSTRAVRIRASGDNVGLSSRGETLRGEIIG